jgi:hypothetical protein
VAALNAYPRLLREGDVHRMLLELSLLNAMQGHSEAAVRIAGFALAHVGENGSSLVPLIKKRLDRLLVALAPENRTRLAAEGVRLRDEEVFKVAFGNTV